MSAFLFAPFASFSHRFSLLLLLTFWRHDRHHRRSLLLHQLLRPEIAPAAPAHLLNSCFSSKLDVNNDESSDFFLLPRACVSTVAHQSLGAAVAAVAHDSLAAPVANDSLGAAVAAAAVANDSLGAAVATSSGTCASCIVFEAANAELGPRRGGIVPATGLATFLHLGLCLGSRLSSTANLHSHLLKGSLRSTTHLHRRGRPSHRVATQREEQEAQRGCRHNGHGNLHFYRNSSQSRRTAVTLYLWLLHVANNA